MGGWHGGAVVIGPRDAYASDLDYDAAMGHSYDAADWCLLHGQRKDSCGQCISDELELDRAAQLMAALDKIDGGNA